MLLALGVAACASFELTEAECRSTNWSERGREDARAGHPSQLVRLRQQCASHGVQIDQRAYLEGYRVGYDEWDRLMGSMRSR
jgi:hypothetical protein